MRHMVIKAVTSIGKQKHSSSNSHNFRLAQNTLPYLGTEKITKELKKNEKEKHHHKHNLTENRKCSKEKIKSENLLSHE